MKPLMPAKMLKTFKIYTCTNGTLGLHLSRAPWDPYPWVSSIQKDSTSYQAGVRIGDCLLELNSQDVLGMKISEIAALLKNHWLNESSNYVTVVIWRNKCNSNNANTEHTTANDCNKTFNGDGNNNHNHHADDGDGFDDDDDEDEENNAHNINQQSLQKFATCLQHIAQLLECPVCLEVIKPPGWQCCNGHVLCNNCRSRSEKCPVCRVPLGPRGRCLLSDKLFTLLADSFPCDGVRSNKNSPKDRRKCNTEFHNQPKMAIVQKQQQLQQDKYEQQTGKKSKDFLFTSLRQGSRKMSNSKANEQGQTAAAKTENKHPSMQKHGMYDTSAAAADAVAAAAASSAVVVVGGSVKRNSSNRESPLDYNSQVGSIVEQQPSDDNVKGVVATTTFCYNSLQEQPTIAAQQCHCLTCSKSNRVAIVNNVTATQATATTATAVSNKYILRIPSQEHVKNIVQQHEEKYKNYQCPTGKLCCLKVYVMPPHHDINTNTNTTCIEKNVNSETNQHTHLNVPATNKKTKQSVFKAGEQQQTHQVNGYKFYKILKNEWDILLHLTEDHQLPVNQYYGEYGQRIRVQVQYLIQQNSITCLNLRASQEGNVAKEEKFFIACVPLEINYPTQTPIASKVAIFLYHMNPVITNGCTTTPTTALYSYAELSNFETIIENPLTGIKWFGCALPLTTPWSYIHAKEHFYPHNVLQNHLLANSNAEATASDNSDDAFVIIVKRKLEIKTK